MHHLPVIMCHIKKFNTTEQIHLCIQGEERTALQRIGSIPVMMPTLLILGLLWIALGYERHIFAEF